MVKLAGSAATVEPRESLWGFAVLFATALCGCSSQELYATGQGWQRQECNKIIDSQERSRCMASASRSYEEYKRESEGSKIGK